VVPWVLKEQGGRFGDVFVTSVSDGTVIPPGPEFQIYKNVMWKLMSLALSGRMQPEQVLKQGQDIFDERIESVRRYDEP
jgi:maltose-binding protein MalE